MSLSRYLVYAIITSLLAVLVIIVTVVMDGWPSAILGWPEALEPVGMLTYVTFIAWACYFLFGANPKDVAKALVSMIVGIIFAIIIFLVSGAFADLGLGFWALPLAAFIIVIFMLLCGRVPHINNIPAIFVGAGVFFSLASAGAFAGGEIQHFLLVGGTQLLYTVMGFFAGWLTIMISGLLTKKEDGA